MTAKGSIAAADEPSPLLRELRETADSDEASGSLSGARDASGLREIADLLSERRYAEAYARYRSLDTWVREGVSLALHRVMVGGSSYETHPMTVDEAWRLIRSEEINERLKAIDAEADQLRAELAIFEVK